MNLLDNSAPGRELVTMDPLPVYRKESAHRIAPFPWARTGPGEALDGKSRFDLTKYDEEYRSPVGHRLYLSARGEVGAAPATADEGAAALFTCDFEAEDWRDGWSSSRNDGRCETVASDPGRGIEALRGKALRVRVDEGGHYGASLLYEFREDPARLFLMPDRRRSTPLGGETPKQ